jgi:hypothetical protein
MMPALIPEPWALAAITVAAGLSMARLLSVVIDEANVPPSPPEVLGALLNMPETM